MAKSYLKEVKLYTFDPEHFLLGFISKLEYPPYDDSKYIYWDFPNGRVGLNDIILDPKKFEIIRMIKKNIFGDLVLHFMGFDLEFWEREPSKHVNVLINDKLFYNYSRFIPKSVKDEYWILKDRIEIKSSDENTEQNTKQNLFTIQTNPVTYIKPGPRLQRLVKTQPTKCFYMYINFGEVHSGSEINSDVKVIFLQNFYSKMYDWELPKDTLLYLDVHFHRYAWNEYMQNLLKLI